MWAKGMRVNSELHVTEQQGASSLLSIPNASNVNFLRTMRWVRHVARTGQKINMYRVCG
jgi:hypothetical protein